MTSTRVIIFAKAPVPGRVKTRLISALGKDGAAELARTMLLETLAEARAAEIGIPEICVDPHPADPAWVGLLPESGFHVMFQGGGDLGERLARATVSGLAEDGAVLLIGTDCPALDRDRLREMAARLRNSDAVVCPAEDGGYVALGLRKFDRSLFTGISWSSPVVAEQTIGRIEALGWSLDIGETLRDIDVPADLEP